jgi:mono/diheme cytochrome c family protein
VRRADGLLIAAAVALVAACGPQRRGALVGRPVVPDTAAERRGERLFFRHCSRCHPGGEAGLGPALNDKPLPEGAVETQIRAGVGSMPAFPDRVLDDEQVSAIADYVTELRVSTAPSDRSRARAPAAAP